MIPKNIAVLLVAGSLILSACGARTDGEGGKHQLIYNAAGELIIDADGNEVPPVAAANPQDELSLRVISDVNSIATGGSDVATITAMVTNADNNAVAGTEVSFKATGGVLQNISGTTDANGEASATLKLQQVFQNQDIFVTASASDFESSVKVIATGSTLEVSGPDNLVSGDTAELVLRLIAGNGEPIANQPLVLSSAAGNSVSPSELITDADGQAQVEIGTANLSDTVNISALNGTVSVSHSFDVVADLLSFVNILDTTELTVGSESLVRVNWISQGQPVAGQALSFAITAGRIEDSSTVITDSGGSAAIRVSSDSAGPAKITVQAAAGGAPMTDIDIEFVATAPATVTIDASSSLINVNETSTVSALVRDRLGNPVKNSEVNFSGADLKGGQLNPAYSVTNSAGIATVTFTAGEGATREDEITIRAAVEGSDIEDRMNLTVFKRALNITLGSANLISVKPLGTQYAMPLVVQVSDGSGTPLEGATVKVSIRPLRYYKGYLEMVDKNGMNLSEVILAEEEFEAERWNRARNYIVCPAEDLDGDRYLDTLGAVSEDINKNGSLDPQDPASLAAIEGNYATLSAGALSTDKNGSGFFEMLYPASNASWSLVEITARAEALGAEATDTYRARLAMPASVINNTEASPANIYSPYGTDVGSDITGYVESDGVLVPVFSGCTTTN